MAYEYESRLKNRLLDLEFDTWEETAQCEREYRELERVYRKAKAFDEVIKKVETEFVSEDLADAIHILVNDYEYDKEDNQMDYKKSFTDATKATMKNGGKDIATKVVPVILTGVGSIIVGIINQDK